MAIHRKNSDSFSGAVQELSGTAVCSPSSTISGAVHSGDTAQINPTDKEKSAVVSTSITESPERFRADFIDPLIPVQPVPYAAAKRLFDILFSSLLMLGLSPVYIGLVLGVKLTSKGPVFFKQVRVGKGGRYFYCLKFRSMCVDAEARKKELEHLNEATGPVFKMKRDPRITRFGMFMRKFSLDELPQFINVLCGHMSVVGPRPPIPAEVAQYSERDRKRLAVVPGITCYWQISGRSNLTFEEWVDLDLKYIETMSFGNDLMIVLKTVPAVITGSGAH